ncbi:hypothetical protein [Micromonospora echinofusca]|uniref:Lipoprotein n=1 Tax=Micromonospora echinofusca TaxID=47858 RepID=A0ABS3VUG2_MICEH|nr:hypothetical protein [Micromonospora echinofusca]MBO4208106.1 hypothetical protein [Micromonospora echinofusca]
MKIRRWSLVGVATVVLFTPALAACGSSGGTEEGGGTAASPAAASPTTAADPKQVLLASTSEIKKGNFRFTVAGDGMTGEGQVHQPSKSARYTLKAGDAADGFSMNMDVIYVEPSSWAKLDFDGEMAAAMKNPKLEGKYQHLDQSKVKKQKGLGFDWNDIDPAGSDLILKGIVDVQAAGEGAYAGTVDVTKATEAGLLDEETVKALATKAAALPFTATVDQQGRLTALSIDFPAVGESKAHQVKVTYADYGAATKVDQPPAAQVVEAPASTYQMLNS